MQVRLFQALPNWLAKKNRQQARTKTLSPLEGVFSLHDFTFIRALLNRAGKKLDRSGKGEQRMIERDSIYEGRDAYDMDIDRMVNEGLGGGQVTEQNGLIEETSVDTLAGATSEEQALYDDEQMT